MELRLALKYRFPVLLILVAVADWWFYGEYPLGWVLGAFPVLLLAACWPRKWDFAPRRVVAIEFGAIALTALSLVYAPGGLNIFLMFLLLYITRITMMEGWRPSTAFWLVALPVKLFTSPIEWMGMLFGRRDPSERLLSERSVRRVALWVLPILITALFAWLFAMANPILERFFRACFNVLAAYVRIPSPEHVAFWVLMVLILASVMSLRLYGLVFHWLERCRTYFHLNAYPRPNAAVLGRLAEWERTIGAMMGRGLVLFNLLFLVQNIFDVEYLWAGLKLPAGVTYAEYAHRGAYPLIAVALLSGALVMVVFRRDGAARNSAWLRWMVYVWLGQNIFLIASSILRLEKYVSVYNLTLLRVAAFLWMLLVAAGMVLLMYRIYSNRGNGWLLRANLLAVLVLLLGCGFLNIAGFVADYNVAHCREATGDDSHAALDSAYLLDLGYPALPALLRAEKAGWCDEALESRIRNLRDDTVNWRRWTLRKALTLRRIDAE